MTSDIVLSSIIFARLDNSSIFRAQPARSSNVFADFSRAIASSMRCFATGMLLLASAAAQCSATAVQINLALWVFKVALHRLFTDCQSIVSWALSRS
jgi:hypothetical protein